MARSLTRYEKITLTILLIVAVASMIYDLATVPPYIGEPADWPKWELVPTLTSFLRGVLTFCFFYSVISGAQWLFNRWLDRRRAV